jgi:hypothetical protein
MLWSTLDDGSTAIEVAIKMAFRKFSVDHGMTDADFSSVGTRGGGTQLQVQ